MCFLSFIMSLRLVFSSGQPHRDVNQDPMRVAIADQLEFNRLYPSKTLAELVKSPETRLSVVCGNVVGCFQVDRWWYAMCDCGSCMKVHNELYVCTVCGRTTFGVKSKYGFLFFKFVLCLCLVCVIIVVMFIGPCWGSLLTMVKPLPPLSFLTIYCRESLLLVTITWWCRFFLRCSMNISFDLIGLMWVFCFLLGCQIRFEQAWSIGNEEEKGSLHC